MKSLLSLTIAILFTFSFVKAGVGEEVIKEGTITYTVITDDLDPNMAMFLTNMKMTVLFDKGNLKIDTDMGMGSVVITSNAETKSTLMLMDMLGNRYAIRTEEQAAQEEVEVTFPGETKVIAGYKCKKAVMIYQETELIFYVTDKLNVPDLNAQFPIDKLKGYPLQLELNQGPLKLTMIASEVKAEKMAKGTFDQIVPEGFEEKTMEELKTLTGGMGF
ncbi:MAG: hypothetical protein ACI959_001089 [Limisphaerales bacterium]|jgi:hypothetical protein